MVKAMGRQQMLQSSIESCSFCEVSTSNAKVSPQWGQAIAAGTTNCIFQEWLLSQPVGSTKPETKPPRSLKGAHAVGAQVFGTRRRIFLDCHPSAFDFFVAASSSFLKCSC